MAINNKTFTPGDTLPASKINEIQTCIQTNENELSAIKTGISSMQSSIAPLDGIPSRVTSAENSLSHISDLIDSFTTESSSGGSDTSKVLVWSHPRKNNLAGNVSFDFDSYWFAMYEKFGAEITFDTIELPIYAKNKEHPVAVEISIVSDSKIIPAMPYRNFTKSHRAIIAAEDINTDKNSNMIAVFENSITVPADKCLVIFILGGPGAKGAEVTKDTNVFPILGNRHWFTSDNLGSIDDFSSGTIHTTTTETAPKYFWYSQNANTYASTLSESDRYSAQFNLYLTQTSVPSSGSGLRWESLSGTLPPEKIGSGSISSSKLADCRSMDMCLPSHIYGVTGEQLSIYYDSIVCDSPSNHLFTVTGSNGTALKECWRADTSSPVSKPLIFTAYNHSFEKEYEKSVQLLISSDNLSSPVNVLVAGDSIIANGSNGGMVTYALQEKNTNINCIGTKGSSANQHEGIAGWTLSKFMSSESKFYNPSTSKFDFSYYMSHNSFSECGYTFWHLGINDVFACAGNDVSSLISTNTSYYNTIIESIHNYDPNIKIGLLSPIPPPQSEDLSLSYTNRDFSRWRYKEKLHRYSAGIMKAFSGRQDENVFIVPFGQNLDTSDHFPIHAELKNSHSSVSVNRQNNLHPTDNGYSALADAIYYFIINNL